MIYDLLNIDNDIVEYESDPKKPKRKAILSDDDDIFMRYRFRHIAEVLEGIPNEFNEFVNSNMQVKVQKG